MQHTFLEIDYINSSSLKSTVYGLQIEAISMQMSEANLTNLYLSTLLYLPNIRCTALGFLHTIFLPGEYFHK